MHHAPTCPVTGPVRATGQRGQWLVRQARGPGCGMRDRAGTVVAGSDHSVPESPLPGAGPAAAA
ncbi:hypothetical protein, partial [Streptomyces lydicus]|uniref:hypothetical protein n=1 Tax=Streptomyces lydicus TaxID=47763 RepID=UPI003D9ED43D